MKLDGLTNLVEFDNEGVRRNIAVDVAELKPGGLETIGKWLWERTAQSESRFEVTRKYNAGGANKTLIVIMALVGIHYSGEFVVTDDSVFTTLNHTE